MEIKKEFQNLITPLTAEEFNQLEESIIKYGCRDCLIVWNDILLDGHNRFEICKKHNIKFQTQEIEFETEQESKEWIIKNQFARRNLSAYDRSLLALKYEELFKGKGKEKQGQRTDITKKSWENEEIKNLKEISDNESYDYDMKIILQNIEKNHFGKLRRNEQRRIDNKIYFAKSGDRFKIGISCDPTNRIKQLKTACPDIELIFEIICERKLEKILHKKFNNYSFGGEWFEYSPKIIEEVIKYTIKEAKRLNETGYKIATIAGVSHNTIAKVKVIRERATKEQKEEIRKGESINKIYQNIKNLEEKEKIKTNKIDLPIPKNKFRTLVIDPPWDIQKIERKVRPNQTKQLDYPVMSVENIKAFDINKYAFENSHIYLWTTHKYLPEAFEIFKS